MEKKWSSELPDNCQICNRPFGKHFIDGNTTLGSWALMCEECHRAHGKGLGIGRGQKYLTATKVGIGGFKE